MNWKKVLAGALLLGVAQSGVHAQDATTASDDQIARGETVFTLWCAACHSAGPGMPGTQALQAKYQGSLPAVLTQRSDLTPDLISFYVRNGISVMPFFRKTEVGDADLEALAAYIVTEARDDG